MRRRPTTQLVMFALAAATMAACAVSFRDVGAISGGSGGGGATTSSSTVMSSSSAIGSGGSGGKGNGAGAGGAGAGGADDGGADAGPTCPHPDTNLTILAVAAGRAHTCAAVGPGDGSTGSVLCWGDNTYGQLGSSGAGPKELTASDLGVEFSGVDVVLLAAGDDFTCFSKSSSDSVVCWGKNDSAQSSQDANITAAPATPTPTPSTAGFTVAGLAAGGRTACVLDQGGGVFCWGAMPPGGGTPTAAVDVTNDAGDAQAVGVGGNHVCFLRGTDHVPHCFGDNTEGQCGYDAGTPAFCYETPGGKCGDGGIPSAGPNSVTQITYKPNSAVFALGGEHTCIEDEDSTSWTCFGADHEGQCDALSNAVVAPSGPNTPAASQLNGANFGAAGAAHTCVVSSGAGQVLCWGDNTYQQAPSTTMVLPFAPVSGLVAGANHNCIWSGPQLLCWGDNQSGQVSGAATTNAISFENGTAPCLTTPALDGGS